MASGLRKALFGAGLSLALLLVGCGNSIIPGQLSVQPGVPSTVVGNTVQVRVILTTGMVSQDVTASASWLTSSPAASVSQGHFGCTVSGNYAATVAYQNLHVQVPLTCVAPPPVVTGLRFSTVPAFVRSEMPFQFRLFADYSDGTTADVTSSAKWSDDSSVAAVSAGLMDCNNAGSTNVQASYSGQIANATIRCILRSTTPLPTTLESSLQFVGPFPSWTNVKTGFGATGNGVTDDSDAFINAIASLNPTAPVLWIPSGTYVITKSLALQGLQSVMIVGEDPSTTILKWIGPPDSTLIPLLGSTHIEISRLTLSGSGANTTAISVDIGAYYPTFDYFHDLRINNFTKGIADKFAGETTIDRVHFANDITGVSLENGNAQNINITDSLFTDCGRGITNWFEGGAFYASNDYFVRSTIADVSYGNTGPFSVRNSVSIDSLRFFESGWNMNPSNFVVENNTIVRTGIQPLTFNTPAVLSLIDNRFIQLNPSFPIVWGQNPAAPMQVLSLGNRFSNPDPFLGIAPFSGNPIPSVYANSIDETAYAADSDPVPQIPSEVYTPRRSNAAIFEIARGSTDQQIHAVVNAALASGQPAVVHFEAGLYALSSTLTLPPDSRLTLAGDAGYTTLGAATYLNGPILRIAGRTASIQNLVIGSAGGEDAAVEVDIPDQPDSYFRCDECATLSHGNSLQVDGVDDAQVLFEVGTLNAGTWGATVHGGTSRQAGVATLGRSNVFGASTDDFRVDGGGQFLLEDGWHDVGQGPNQTSLSGNSVVEHQGGTIYVNGASPTIRLTGFTGDYSMLGLDTNSNATIDSASSGDVFIGGVLQRTGINPVVNKSSKAVVSEVDTQATGTNSWPYTNFSTSAPADAFAERMMRLVRTEVRPPHPAMKTGTDIRMTRVLTVASPIGIHVKGVGASSNGVYRIAAGTVSQSFCSTQPSMTSGEWTLQDGGDGSFGLLQSGSYLSEDIATNGSPGVSRVSTMDRARTRWLLSPNGDGTVAMVNRATGDFLTLERDGCVYGEAGSAGTTNQAWIVTNTAAPN